MSKLPECRSWTDGLRGLVYEGTLAESWICHTSDHSDYEILEHLTAVVAALGEDFPIYLYDNPLYTGIHLTPERVQRYLDAVPSLCWNFEEQLR